METVHQKPRMRINDVKVDDIWEVYQIKGKFREYVYGGVPADPNILEGHLARKGLTMTDMETAKEMHEKTLELETVEGQLSATTNVFYADDEGVYLCDYQFIGALKEAAARTGYLTAWRSKIQNGVRVHPARIHLTRDGETIKQFDGYEQSVVHTEIRGIPVTSIKRMAYIDQPEFEFEIWVVKNGGKPLIDELAMTKLIAVSRELGIGAMRRMGKGKWDGEYK